MSEKFKELLKYAIKERNDCIDEKQEKTLNFIVNCLIDLAHEQGYVEDVSQMLEEFC